MVKVLRATPERRWSKRALLLVLIVVTAFGSLTVSADERDQAKRIHDRIAGVPPDGPTLNLMADAILSDPQNGAFSAALIATDNPSFYNVTLKNFVAPWTNRDQAVFVPLNDYTATVIGMVRDDVDFRNVLYGDILYTVSGRQPRLLDLEQCPLRRAEAQAADLKARLVGTVPQSTLDRRAVVRDRGRTHLARRIEGLLHRRHQPRDVPVHAC